MKKILTHVSLAVLITATAHGANTFKSGFKIGVGAGYKRHSSTLKKAYSPGETALFYGDSTFSSNKSTHSNKALGQFHIGVNYIRGKLYSALELDYRYGPSKVKKQTNDFFLTPARPGSSRSTTVEQNHKHDFGITGKFGQLVKPSVALYGIANIRYGIFKNRLTSPDLGNNILQYVNTSTKQNKKLIGFGGGVGCAYAMRNHTSLALDLTYDFYKHTKSKKNAINSNNVTMEDSVLNFRTRKTRIFNAIVKLSKTF